MKLRIGRVTNSEDAQAWLKVLRGVARVFTERNLMMWPEENFSDSWALPFLGTKQMILGKLNNLPAAVMLLLPEDKDIWPNAKLGESMFVHKLAVARTHKGMGLAKEMIHWAKQEAKSLGCTYLRLDTDSTRPVLCKLYEDMGFTAVGEVHHDIYFVRLYECSLG